MATNIHKSMTQVFAALFFFVSVDSSSIIDFAVINNASLNGSECTNYTVLNSHDRAQNYTSQYFSKCDRSAITDGLWYRFMGAAGTAMPTSCVPSNRCGTDASGWMNGSHPTQAEGIVQRTVCYNWYSYYCCSWRNNIFVRNCGGFYVYQLFRPQGCNYRYCGNGVSGYGCGGNNTCLNGGTCWNSYYGYYCSCPSGYSGRHCEARYGCHNGTCLNGGTCRNSYYGNGYYCSCPYGYSGRHCETSSGCQRYNHTCINGGTCSYGYYCSCPTGYTGRRCETSYGCSRYSPCLNGGTCRNKYYGYYCSCPSEYTGRHCETNLKVKVTCGERFMEVELRRAFYRDIDWRGIHLNDPACRATATWSTILLRTPLDGCGTTCFETSATIEFWNKVIFPYSGSMGNNSITRESTTLMNIYCKYTRRQLVSTSFAPSKKIVHVSEGNIGNFTFAMNLYRKSDYKNPYLPFDYPVPVSQDQTLWVQFEVKNAITDLVLFADSCRATTSINPNSYPQYVFLKGGCKRDSTMVYNYDKSSSVQRFSIKSFRFIYSSNKLVYLHCELMVCHRNSTNSRCSSGCIRSRRRRKAAEDSSQLYDLSVGPFKGQGGNTENNKQTNGAQKANVGLSVGLGVVGGLLLIVCGVILFKKLQNVRLLRQETCSPSPPIGMDVAVNSYDQNDVDLDEREVEIKI